MRSPITLANKIHTNAGFLIPEIMLSFALMTLLVTSALVLSFSVERLREQAISNLANLEQTIPNLASTTLTKSIPYGNDTEESSLEPITKLASEYTTAWGRDSCIPEVSFDPTKTNLYSTGINLGPGNISTDIEVRDGYVYLTADSSVSSVPDLYIINATNPTNPILVSSLNTGPGLSSLEVAGHYIYTANLGTTNQLQVIDISDRTSPLLVAKLKLPLPFATSTAPFATAIFYDKGFIYFGTQKWDGNEFSIIDVSTPSAPKYMSGFKTNTLISDIYVRSGLAYLAASDIGQMRVLDVHDPTHITPIAEYSPSGWTTQESKVISFFENIFSLGRTTGGYDVETNHEFFLFSTTTPITLATSHNIPGGVYGILYRPPFIYISTKSSGHEFQIWNQDMTSMLYDKSLGFSPEKMACDGDTLYFATGNSRGFAELKLK